MGWTNRPGLDIDELTSAEETWVTASAVLGDSSSTQFVKQVSTGLVNGNFVDYEVPTGTIDGSNTAFTLANTPSPLNGTKLVKNGVLQDYGAGNDFTVSGTTLTYASAPQTGSKHWVFYRY
mgnify:CR=1 FL=1